MVKKNNLVLAIKTLSTEEGITMGEAKTRIDAYEAELKATQQKDLEKIQQKQQSTQKKNTPSKDNTAIQSLQSGLDNHLHDIGYKKPLIPHWAKRLIIIAIIMAGIFFILWNSQQN